MAKEPPRVDDSQTIEEKFGLFITERLTGGLFQYVPRDIYNTLQFHGKTDNSIIKYSCVLTKKNHWSIIFPTDLEFYHTLKKSSPSIFKSVCSSIFFLFSILSTKERVSHLPKFKCWFSIEGNNWCQSVSRNFLYPVEDKRYE